MLLWHGEVPFCCSLMFKKFLSLPNHSIRVCVKRNRINRGVGYGLKIPVQYIYFLAMRKLFSGQRENEMVSIGKSKKKSFKIFKTKSF